MTRSLNIYLSCCLYLFSACALRSQELPLQSSNYGFTAGLQLAFGTHFQRAGINLHFYYLNGQVQTNSAIRLYYSFRNLGPRLKHPEIVLSQGLLVSYGEKTNEYNPFLNSVSNQTSYKSSVGYSYNAYFNKKKTTQQTGIVSLEFDRVSFMAENDLLARPALDRFRTGAFLLQYNYDSFWQVGINCTMWTGRMGQKAGIIHPNFNYQCYMDTTGSVYGNYSNGLLSAQVQYHAGFGQIVQANGGIDAEQVRNAVQNEFIHDMNYIPKRYNKARNCHIPMIDRLGQQFLYKEDQQIKKPSVYLNLFTNPNLFY